MSNLRDMRRQARKKALQDAQDRFAEPRPRQRLDGGLLAVLTTMAVLALGGSYTAVSWIVSSGRFDPPLMNEVDDLRILTDYRDNLSPMHDMVNIGNDLLIGRQDGSIDRFDMAGRTFATESLPRNDQLSGDLALLSTDCAAAGCDDEAIVYAVTTAGGLAERRGGKWRTLLGDGAFHAADGTPVEQADVIGWAASADGALVLVNAGEKGIGLFDQRSGIWHVRAGIEGADKGPLFYSGAFWLGAKDGLHRLAVGLAGFDGTKTLVPDAEGEIVDLSLSVSDGLLVLRRGPCDDGQSGCMALLGITQRGEVETLHAEAHLDPGLNDSGLSHVARQGEDLVTLGTAGVHLYSANSRNWTIISRQEPTAYFAEADGNRLLVGLPDSFIAIRDGKVTARTPLEAPLKQILPGPGTELFGLDLQGRVLRLGGATPIVLAESDPGIPANASFLRAAAIGSLFVALGPEGILVHDSAERRYSFTPASGLPPLPVSDVLLVPGSGGRLWIITRSSGEVQSLTITGEFPQKQLKIQSHGSAQMAVVQAHAVTGGLDIVASDGTLLRLNSAQNQIVPLVGPGLKGGLRPVSMAVAGPIHFFAGTDRVWAYDQDERSWTGPDAAPQDGKGLVDIAVAGDRLVALDSNGTVYWREPQGWKQVYGGPIQAQFGAAAVQDVMGSGGTLFLASDSTVQAYVPGQRRFGPSWKTKGRNAEILAIVGNEPLWKNSSGVYTGEKPFFNGAEFIDGWMGAGGPVAMGERRGRRYISSGQDCLYMGVAAPQGEILDVVALDDERLLVRTAQGAGIYQPALHRWLKVTGLGGNEDSRFMNMGGHLVRLDPTRVSSIRIDDIDNVRSCRTDDVAISWQINLSGVHASQVDGAAQVLVLSADGSLQRWAGGEVMPAGSAPGAAPAIAGPGKVYSAADGGLHFLGLDALWHYRLSDRTWSKQSFVAAPRGVEQVDFVQTASGPLVSLWDGNGALWQGQPNADGKIQFQKIERPVLPVIPIPPDEIRDMAQFQTGIAVLSDRRLLIYDEGQEVARADITLPAPTRAWQLASDLSDQLILVDGEISAPVAIHRIEGSIAKNGALADISAPYVPDNDRSYTFSRDGTKVELFRVDSSLNTWRCRLIQGRPLPDCDLLAGVPMQVEAQRIRGFDPQKRVLLTDDALWMLDNALRPLERIDGPIVGADSVLFSNGGALMLWEGPNGALWRIDDAKAIRVLDNVGFLRAVGSDAYAALAGGQVQGIVKGHVAGLLDSEQLRGDPTIHSHFTTSGHVILTRGGVALAGQGRLRSDALIAFDPDVVTVLPVESPDVDKLRWLQELRGGKLNLIWVGECEIPAPAPAPLPAEFIGPPAPVIELPPIIEPCVLNHDLPVQLEPDEHVLDLDARTAGVLRIATNQRELTVEGDGADIQSLAITALTNDIATRDSLREKVVELDGLPYLNPPRLSDSSIDGLADRITLFRLAPVPLDAFDAGWISWLRDGKHVRFDTVSQPVEMQPTEAIREGRFLPAHPAKGAALTGGNVAWLSAYGLWHQSEKGMRRVSDQGMVMPKALYQGAFLDAGQGIRAADGALEAGLGLRNLDVDTLKFSIDPLQQQVAATITVSGQQVQALATNGFLHDQRQSVAQTKDVVAYLTPVGLVSQDRLTGAQLLPDGARLLASENGSILAQTPTGWMRQDGQLQWQPAAAPFLSGSLARENGRIWERVNGAVVLRAADPAEGWRLARQGLNFDIDQLQGFAATPQVAVAFSRAGTHAATSIDGLAGVSAPTAQAPGDGELDSARVSPTRHILFHKGPAGYQVWDAEKSQWRTPSAKERPWEASDLAKVEGISAVFRGQIEFSVAVDTVGAETNTLPFSWNANEAMPFDHATAIYGDVQAGTLLVGTRLGLRRLRPLSDGYASEQLFVPVGSTSAAAVNAIGRPAATPGRIVAGYASGCAQFSAIAAVPVTCSDPEATSQRFVTQTETWRWTKSDGAVAGEYLLEDGSQLPLKQPLQGRLPHDSLADSMTCKNIRAELWRDADVVWVAGKQHRLSGVQGLFCQTSAAKLEEGAGLEAGLYALTSAGVLRMDGGKFMPISGAQENAVADRVSGRVVLESGRLRYGIEQGAIVTHYLDLASRWRPTPWQAGRLLLDQPRALARHDRGLQLVTDAGVFDAPGGHLVSAGLVLMSGADENSLAGCATDHVEMLDGRSHGLGKETGSPLRLYCKDGSWLQGVADNSKDQGSFTKVSAVESQRLLVDALPLWQVRQDIDAMGRTRKVDIIFREEPARLSAGRFDFDTFRGISAPFRDKTELLSETGWWRAPSGIPRLSETQRVQSGQITPRDVLGVATDRSRRSDTIGLCLTMSGGNARWWDGGNSLESVADCREIRGSDPLWRWWHADDKPFASALAMGGSPIERRLSAGRFEDLIVRGAPVIDPQGRLLVSGMSGVLVLDQQLTQPVAIHSAPSDVLLTRAHDGKVVQIDRQGARFVEDSPGPASTEALACPALAVLVSVLPEDHRLSRATILSDRRASVMTEGPDGGRQVLLACDDPAPGRAWTAAVDISNHPRALAAGSRRASTLALSVNDDQVLLDDGTTSATIRFPGAGLRAILPRPGGKEIFLIEKDRLWSASVSTAIGILQHQGSVKKAAAKKETATTMEPPMPAPTVVDSAPAEASQMLPADLGRPPSRWAPTPVNVTLPSAQAPQFEPAYDPRKIQMALQRVIDKNLTIDGTIGPTSRRAIAEWQLRIGSKPTGYLGHQQWRLLMKEVE